MSKTDLSTFNNDWYNPGSGFGRAMWFIFGPLFVYNPLNPFSSLKRLVLRMFGAKIGKGVVIKPRVTIKYPWRLNIGDHVWIGEYVWIDNLANVEIGSHSCISQGAMLLCGNHNYKKPSFDLIIGDIKLEDGVWIGAHAVVTPGVECKSHSVLSVNSVATKDLQPYTVYQGNPAIEVRKREIHEQS